jgi:hypothetical protein
MVFMFGGSCFADLNAGLVLHYPFNGNADDISDNVYNGTEQGGISYVDGVIGQAVKLNGVDGYIESSYSPSYSVH